MKENRLKKKKNVCFIPFCSEGKKSATVRMHCTTSEQQMLHKQSHISFLKRLRLEMVDDKDSNLISRASFTVWSEFKCCFHSTGNNIAAASCSRTFKIKAKQYKGFLRTVEARNG